MSDNNDKNKEFPFDNVIDLAKELPPPTQTASRDSNEIFKRIIEFLDKQQDENNYYSHIDIFPSLYAACLWWEDQIKQMRGVSDGLIEEWKRRGQGIAFKDSHKGGFESNLE